MPEAEIDEAPRKLELSTTQITASALAAVSAAVFASWFGTAGTLIGAALGSVVATVGSATYSYSLNRTAEIARRTALQVKESGVIRPGRTRAGGAAAEETSVIAPVEDDAAPTDAKPEVAWWRRLDPRGADLPWGRIALASAAVMLVAMVAITTFEGLTGRSVAQYTGNDESGSTTVGNVFGGGEEQQEAPTETPTDDASEETTPSPTADPTTDPTADPTPSATPTAEPSETADENTTQAPVPTPSPTAPSLGATPSATPSP